jgi:hypothetical protein
MPDSVHAGVAVTKSLRALESISEAAGEQSKLRAVYDKSALGGIR